jgi:hypothetical protein
MIWSRAAQVSVTVCLFLSIASPSRATTYTARLLHPAGYSASRSYGASAGVQVGTAYDYSIPSNNHAYLWRGTAASAIDLHPVGYVNSHGTAAAGDSQVGAGEDQSSREDHALLWRGSAASVVDLHPAAFRYSQAIAASPTQQVGQALSWPDQNFHAFLWSGTAASAVDLHPGGTVRGSRALGVAGGKQVGAVEKLVGSSFQYHAYLWSGTAASGVDLHPAGFSFSEANAIDGLQQVGLGNTPTTSNHALLWKGTAASVVDLHPAKYAESQAHAIAGSRVAGIVRLKQPNAFGYQAVLWEQATAASVMELHPLLAAIPGIGPNFVYSDANGVDAQGNVVGVAYTADFTPHAVMWSPVPEPGLEGMGCVVLAAGIGLARPRRRRGVLGEVAVLGP